MENTNFYETNKAIFQLIKEFSQMTNEFLGRVNAHVHIYNEILRQNSESCTISLEDTASS